MVVGLRPVFVAHFLSLLLELEELLEELLGLHCLVGYSGATDDPPLCGRLLVVLVQPVAMAVLVYYLVYHLVILLGLVQVNSNPLGQLALIVPPSLLGSYPVSPLAFLHVFQSHSQSSPVGQLLVLGQAQCSLAGAELAGKEVAV